MKSRNGCKTGESKDKAVRHILQILLQEIA